MRPLIQVVFNAELLQVALFQQPQASDCYATNCLFEGGAIWTADLSSSGRSPRLVSRKQTYMLPRQEHRAKYIRLYLTIRYANNANQSANACIFEAFSPQSDARASSATLTSQTAAKLIDIVCSIYSHRCRLSRSTSITTFRTVHQLLQIFFERPWYRCQRKNHIANLEFLFRDRFKSI